MRLSAKWRQMTDFIGLTDKDTALLYSKKETFETIADTVTDELYARILVNAELKALIERFSTLERLKKTQRAYFVSMCTEELDDAYMEQRLHIGRVHSRVGLTPQWYLGTYMLYLDVAVAHLRQVSPHDWMDVTLALSKMFNLDSRIAIEAYEEEERAKIGRLAEERGNMLRVVTSSVQELTAMVAELSVSSQSVADNARLAAGAQERSSDALDGLGREIEDISQVGSVMRELSDRTHLLGLNAAIEAAHAGEYGKGFGVVAEEVRKLAAMSKESLDTVHRKLEAIQQALREASQENRESTRYAGEQAAIAQELNAYVQMIERVVQELDALRETAKS